MASGGGFIDVSGSSGFDHPDDGRGMTPVDWDGDGDLDILTSNRNAPQIRFLRNDIPSADKHWLGIHLKGTGNVNRDAIGARVTVSLANGPPLIRTLRAGEGFQAQNSKWLHFGLGSSAQISGVTVAWPNGETQSYTNVKADQRYRLVCGETTIKADAKRKIEWPTPLPELETQTFDGGQANTASRLPVPVLPYLNAAGQITNLTPGKSKRLTLVNLWATWCTPCVTELKEFASEKARLEKAGLDVVALSLDGVNQRAGDPKVASKFMKGLGNPFVSGVATPESLEKILILHDQVYEKRGSITLPTSLLIDQNGRLAGYYEGGMDIETLMQRVEIAKQDEPQDAMTESLPFAGRWLARPLGFLLTQYGNALLKKGYADDAVSIWNRFERDFDIDPKASTFAVKLGLAVEKKQGLSEAIKLYEQAVQLNPRNPHAYASLAGKYMQLQRGPEALNAYKAALKIDPSLVEARYNLGILLARSKRNAEALVEFLTVVEKSPKHALAHANIASLKMKDQDLEAAIEHLRLALEGKPDFTAVRFQLGRLLEAVGETRDAIQQYELLLKQQPSFAPAVDRLKKLGVTPNGSN